jgi:DNA (cytosine-5)-methyltransferase 1
MALKNARTMIASGAIMIKVLDLFSGVGGFSLGLERTGGFQTVAFCEIDPFCRAVLRKHWLDVPQYEDVRNLSAGRLRADGISVDAICGGFPCQDISTAGRNAGLDGERSGLWTDYARIVRELRPSIVIVENVSALLGRGLNRVLGDLAALGYDAEWHCIPASAVGARHQRDRVWIVAYPNAFCAGATNGSSAGQSAQYDARSLIIGGSSADDVADAIGFRQSGSWKSFKWSGKTPILDRQAIDAFASSVGNIWRVEPDVGRVANGVPDRLDRLKGLGNAVVPQIPEIIGRAILRAMEAA